MRAGGKHLGPRFRGQRAEGGVELVGADDGGVVVDEQRAIGGQGLGDAGDRLLLDQVLERQDPRIDLAVDLVGQLHRHGEIAAGQEARLGIDQPGGPRPRSPRAGGSACR